MTCLEKVEWRIPAARVKMGELRIVPLSRQALEIPRTPRGNHTFGGESLEKAPPWTLRTGEASFSWSRKNRKLQIGGCPVLTVFCNFPQRAVFWV